MWSLRLLFKSSMKNCIGIIIRIVMNLYLDFRGRHFHNAIPTNPWTWETFSLLSYVRTLSIYGSWYRIGHINSFQVPKDQHFIHQSKSQICLVSISALWSPSSKHRTEKLCAHFRHWIQVSLQFSESFYFISHLTFVYEYLWFPYFILNSEIFLKRLQ